MGANLNRLMQSYGVYTPTMSPYTGVDTPDALKAGATAGERGTYQGSLADYAAQQDAFKGYERDYRNRIATTDLYTNPGPASTFLSTPNYSGIRGMRANLSDTTSADTTDYTNPNFDSMINDAYRSLGRVGIGTDTGNIDQTGYDYWMNQLRTGAIAPRDFKNQFKIATNDYIRQKPDDDYTKYVQGYLGILPAATLPVLSTPGGDTSLGLGGNTGMGGEGPGANPVGYDGDGKETAGDLSNINGGAIGRGIGALLGGAVAGPLGALLGSFGGSRLGGMLSGSAGAAQASSSNLAKAAEDQESDFAAAAALDTSPGNALGGDIAASGPGDFSGAMGDLAAMARGGPVNSPTSMEEALLSDRSRHEFSDPRFEELYGKYFYADGGGVGGGVANPTDGGSVENRRAYPGVLPMYTGAPRVLDSSAAERGASLGSSGDFSLSAGDPDALMSLVYSPSNLPQVTEAVYPNAPEVDIGQGPAGRVPGAAPVATTPASTAPPAGATQSAPSVLDAIKRNREAIDAYRKGLAEQSSSETDPNAAEKWFRLAAAFLAPTKTGKGAFGEAIGNAAGVMGNIEKENTLRKTAEKNKRDEMGLKGLALDYKLTSDEVLALREDEKERNKALLAIRLKGMESPNRGVEASDINILLNGDPSSREYAAAYARQGASRVMSDGTEVRPNMNWAEVPTFKLKSDSAGGENNYGSPTIVPAPKPIPAAVVKGMTENISAITQIDQTLQELENTQGSGVGFVEGNLPGAIADRINSRGVRLRAMIADIGSMKIHDRSGAAVTAAEFPRLRPFIPSPSDSPETIRTKLEQFRDQYFNELHNQRNAWSVKSGYKPVYAVDDILKKNEPRPESDNIITFGSDGKRKPK